MDENTITKVMAIVNSWESEDKSVFIKDLLYLMDDDFVDKVHGKLANNQSLFED